MNSCGNTRDFPLVNHSKEFNILCEGFPALQNNSMIHRVSVNFDSSFNLVFVKRFRLKCISFSHT